MTIEVHQPELEALLLERMETGRFRSMEELLLNALRPAIPPREASLSGRTGADLLAAMQAMPWPETDIEPSRPYMPVRDPEF